MILDEQRGVAWNLNAATGSATRSRPRTNEHEIEVCAQCHARRGQIAEGYEAGKPFLDYYRPALLTSPLYYADGDGGPAPSRTKLWVLVQLEGPVTWLLWRETIALARLPVSWVRSAALVLFDSWSPGRRRR